MASSRASCSKMLVITDFVRGSCYDAAMKTLVAALAALILVTLTAAQSDLQQLTKIAGPITFSSSNDGRIEATSTNLGCSGLGATKEQAVSYALQNCRTQIRMNAEFLVSNPDLIRTKPKPKAMADSLAIMRPIKH